MTLTRIGTQVYWFIPQDLVVDADTFTRHGMDSVAPENAPRARLIKACDLVKADWHVEAADDDEDATALAGRVDRRRHHDGKETRITFYRPESRGAGEAPEIVRAFTAILNKAEAKAGRLTEALTFERARIQDADFDDRTAQIRDHYLRGETISHSQFRDAVSRFVLKHSGCNGVSLRPGSGGVYFVLTDFDDRLDVLKALFRDAATIYRAGPGGRPPHLATVPIYDDEAGEWRGEVNRATETVIEAEFEAFQEKLAAEAASGKLTPGTWENRLSTADDLLGRATLFSEQLSTRAREFTETAQKWSEVMKTQLASAKDKVIVPFDLAAEMAKIGDL